MFEPAPTSSQFPVVKVAVEATAPLPARSLTPLVTTTSYVGVRGERLRRAEVHDVELIAVVAGDRRPGALDPDRQAGRVDRPRLEIVGERQADARGHRDAGGTGDRVAPVHGGLGGVGGRSVAQDHAAGRGVVVVAEEDARCRTAWGSRCRRRRCRSSRQRRRRGRRRDLGPAVVARGRGALGVALDLVDAARQADEGVVVLGRDIGRRSSTGR